MEYVYQLGQEQALSIQGKQWKSGVYFWWIWDGSSPSNRVLSAEQVEDCKNPRFYWLRDLPQIPWVAPTPPDINNLNNS
jgi:hypothetical protein